MAHCQFYVCYKGTTLLFFNLWLLLLLSERGLSLESCLAICHSRAGCLQIGCLLKNKVYSCVVIILFSTGLYESAFFYIIFWKTTIMFIIFWDFLMVEQIFISPQVKWSLIISKKTGTYELCHELPSDLKKLVNIKKISKFLKMLILPPQMKMLSALPKKLLKNGIWTFWKLQFVSNILWVIVDYCLSVFLCFMSVLCFEFDVISKD